MRTIEPDKPNQDFFWYAITGLVTSFLMERFVYPVIDALWKWWGEVRPRNRLPR